MLAILYHLHMMNPIFPDAQPVDNYLFIAAAAVILWLKRGTMFKRGNGVTDVFISEEQNQS